MYDKHFPHTMNMFVNWGLKFNQGIFNPHKQLGDKAKIIVTFFVILINFSI